MIQGHIVEEAAAGLHPDVLVDLTRQPVRQTDRVVEWLTARLDRERGTGVADTKPGSDMEERK